MSYNTNHLSKFRQFILKNQSKEVYNTLLVLFTQNVPQFTILVTNQMIRTHLRFVSRYNVSWIGDFAQEVIFLTEKQELNENSLDFPRETDKPYTGYGIGSLIGGVIELWHTKLILRLYILE